MRRLFACEQRRTRWGRQAGRLARSAPLTFLSLALVSAAANAQSPCGSQLQTLDVQSGLDGALYDSVLWDRDGSGPLAAELVIGGAFRRV